MKLEPPWVTFHKKVAVPLWKNSILFPEMHLTKTKLYFFYISYTVRRNFFHSTEINNNNSEVYLVPCKIYIIEWFCENSQRLLAMVYITNIFMAWHVIGHLLSQQK